MQTSKSLKVAIAIFVIISMSLVSIGDSAQLVFENPDNFESEDRLLETPLGTRGSRAFIKKVGDWVVTGNEQHNGDTIHLTGNLTIATTGKLTLANSRLVMNCSDIVTFMIQINGTMLGPQGELVGFRTTFRSAKPQYPFKFKVNGTMDLNGCTVKDLWGADIITVTPLSDEVGGIEIRSNNVIIKKSKIVNPQGYAISCMGSEPKIHSNIINGNMTDGKISGGIYCAPLLIFPQSPEIIGNNISNCVVGIRCDADDPIIRYNNISARQGSNLIGLVILLLSNPLIEDNYIGNNVVIGISYIQSGGTIQNNEISNNGLGILCAMDSNPDILGNTIKNSIVGGINLSASSPDIKGNDILNNNLTGIGVDGSNPLIERNDIVAPVDMTGILCLNGSGPNIVDNDIVSGDPTDGSNGFGIYCNESSTPTITGNDFTIYADGIGVSCSGASPSVKLNNFTLKDNCYGVYVESDSSANIEDNNFYGLPLSARADSKYGIFFDDNMPVLISKAIDNTIMNFSSGIRCYDSSGIEIVNNQISNVKNYGVHVEDSDDVKVTQSDVKTAFVIIENSSLITVNLVNANATSLNSSIVQRSVDDESQFWMVWYLHLKVTDLFNVPVEDANVKIFNSSDVEKHDYQTPANGLIKWIRVVEYIEEDRDDDGTVTMYPETPHTIQVEKVGYNQGIKITDMTISKTETVILGTNSPPGMPSGLGPRSTHDITPQITWSPAVDPDGNVLTYHISVWEGNSSAGTLIVDNSTTQDLFFNITTNLSYGAGNKTYYLELHANDGFGGVSGIVGHEFYVFNTPPEIGNLSHKIVKAGETVWFNVTATDPDVGPVDTLTFSEDSAEFEINSSSGEVYWVTNLTNIGEYEIEFTVEDGGGGSASQTINITVLSPNLAPVPDAGEDWTVEVNTTVILNGSGSYDPDGNITGFEWFCITVNVTFTNANTSTPSFTPTMTGIYRIQLRVFDNNLTWSPVWDEVNITVLQPMEPNNEPELKNGSVEPSQGDEQDTYNFTVEYYDEDNDPPAYVQVIINNTMYTMIPANSSNTDYRNGTKYHITIDGNILGAGNHTYNFEASDGTDLATGDIGDHPDLSIEPYVKKDKKDDGGDDLMDLELYSTMCWMLLLVLIVIIIVIIVVIVLLMKKKRREPRYYDEGPYDEEPYDEEPYDEDSYYEEEDDYYEDDEMYEEDRGRGPHEPLQSSKRGRREPSRSSERAHERRKPPRSRKTAPAGISWDDEGEYEDEYDEEYEEEDEYEDEDEEYEEESEDKDEDEDEADWAEEKDDEADWDEDDEDDDAEWEE